MPLTTSAIKIKVTPCLANKMRVISLFAIFFVVLQHASYGVSTATAKGLLYRDLISLGFADFPVPYFFIVSGVFFMKRFEISFNWYRGEIFKRCKTLLIPYFFFTTIGVFYYRHGSFDTALADYGITSLCTLLGALWYVRTLFVLCVLSPILIALVILLQHYKFLQAIVVCAIPCVLIARIPLQSAVIAPILYFSFGIFIALHGPICVRFKPHRKLMFACLLATMLLPIKIVYSFTHPELEPILRKALIPSTLLFVWYGYDVLFERSKVFKMLIEGIPQNWLHATFLIYCTEGLLRNVIGMLILRHVGYQTWGSSVCGPFIMACCVAIVGVVISMMLRNMAPKTYSIITGGRG